jgi:hypothetical protein
MTPKLSLIVVATAAAAAAVACSDSFRPTVDNVSGIYSVREFTTDSAGTTKDWVAAGATLKSPIPSSATWTGSPARIASRATRPSASFE